MDDDQFDNEVRVSCFHGLQRSDVEKIPLDIKENRSMSTIPNGGVTAALIVEQVENRCNNFVVLVNASRAFDRRRKDRQKAYAITSAVISSLAPQFSEAAWGMCGAMICGKTAYDVLRTLHSDDANKKPPHSLTL